MTTTKQAGTGQEKQKIMPAPSAGADSISMPQVTSLPRDAQVVSLGDRLTYTFVQGKEVGSIHFDRARSEIFYKGHNIRNMNLEDWQWQILEGLRKMLATHDKMKSYAESYAHTLDKVVLEKKNHSSHASW